MRLNRRKLLLSVVALPIVPLATMASAQAREVWSAQETWQAIQDDNARLLDIRSREEWFETGVAKGAWPISMHEKRFPERLFSARNLADGRPVAMICATGGRTGAVFRALRGAGYNEFIDVSEGMLGSRVGKGWIAEELPIVSANEALAEMPVALS